MKTLFRFLFLVILLKSITNCSTTPEYTYSTCGHGSNQSDQVRLIFKDKIELLKLSSTPEGLLVDSIRVQGGIHSFLSKIIYPEIAKRAGVEGINGASFTVDSLGNAIDVKLIKGIGAGCDEALLLAIKSQKFVYQSNFSEKFNENIFILIRFKLY
jgi:Gram-negative bacterial TonB protein C-terminal